MILLYDQGWGPLATPCGNHRPEASASWVSMIEIESLRLPPDLLYLSSHFYQISGLIYMKTFTLKIKCMKCESSSFSERKIISSGGIREAFLEEVTSDLGPRVEAVFGSTEYIPAAGAVSAGYGDGQYEDVYTSSRAFGLESDKSNGR